MEKVGFVPCGSNPCVFFHQQDMTAITHVDGSSRIQTVDERCGGIRQILEAFDRHSAPSLPRKGHAASSRRRLPPALQGPEGARERYRSGLPRLREEMPDSGHQLLAPADVEAQRKQEVHVEQERRVEGARRGDRLVVLLAPTRPALYLLL